ncbi:hypothetical protein IAU59_006509 [Kwoniella sp. CBS 9459]
MSVSSATTLISPTNARTSSSIAGTSAHSSAAAGPGAGIQRRPSTHAHAAHGHHTAKRRASAHGHGHGHAGAHGNGRRPSEGDHGRRALAAGLQMHALDTTDAVRRQKKKGDRPLPKSSKSDPNLPRLSRTTSVTSNASHSSEASRATTSTTNTGHTSHKPRPRRNSHVKSEESVHVLDENGQATEEVDDEEGGGWESGDLEISPEKSKKGKMRDPAGAASTVSATMRRAASDSTVDPAPTATATANAGKGGRKKSINHPTMSGILGDGNLVDTPSNINGPHPPPFTQRTTGFAGGVQPLDPQIAAQLPSADPHPIVTPHPIRRNTSAKSLVGPIAMEPVHSDQGVPTEPPAPNDNDDTVQDHTKLSRPSAGVMRHRSTEGSGLPQGREDSASPSYPFPQMPPPDQQDGNQSDATGPTTDGGPRQSHRRGDSQQQHPSRASTHPQPQSQSSGSQPQPRSRQTSSQNGPLPQLRHRYSNSSLRSIQSLRAPPHPLNSPTGYRTASSRPGSMFGSPTKDKRGRDYGRGGGERERVHSMHQPPVPAPQVSYEVAQGQGWDVGIPEEDTPRRSINEMGAGPAAGTAKKRQDSVSSTRSIRSIFAGTMSNPGAIAPSLSQQGEATASSRLQSSSRQRVHSQSQGQSSESAQPRLNRRQTAMEAASAASKMATTSDPALYHHSLGHPSTTAESCFLVSRFLPFKSIDRPNWEMDMRDPLVHEELEAGNLKVGLTNGDYRQAHESLVRTIRQLGLNAGANGGQADGGIAGGGTATGGSGGGGGGGNGKRGASRSYSGYNILTNDHSSHANGHGNGSGTGNGTDNSGDGAGLGTIRGKDGVGMTVSRGAFGGKTPFEMSVQRCLTQRPGSRVGL